jgi:hypothetical protein
MRTFPARRCSRRAGVGRAPSSDGGFVLAGIGCVLAAVLLYVAFFWGVDDADRPDPELDRPAVEAPDDR